MGKVEELNNQGIYFPSFRDYFVLGDVTNSQKHLVIAREVRNVSSHHKSRMILVNQNFLI